MFEDVFEPFDDIIDGGDAQEASDEWGDVWDTGEKEDMWRADAKDVWSVDKVVQPGPQVTHPGPVKPAPDGQNQPKPDPIVSPPGPMNNTPTPEEEPDSEDSECEKACPQEDCGKDSGLFDDLFLDI